MFAITNGSRFFLPTALAVAAAIVSVGTVTAQSPRTVYIPPDVKGYQAQLIRQQSVRPVAPAGPSAARSVSFGPTSAGSAATPPVRVTVSVPVSSDTAFVAIRGPGGEVRYFPVEGGRATLATRVVVVRPGEPVTIRFPAPPWQTDKR